MGGALALLLHRKKPDYWDGAVLVAPMCKVYDPNETFLFFNTSKGEIFDPRTLVLSTYTCPMS